MWYRVHAAGKNGTWPMQANEVDGEINIPPVVWVPKVGIQISD